MKNLKIAKLLNCYIAKVQKGFTLIELLVAIAIIAVLASSAFVVMNPLEQFAKSRDAQRKNDLAQIRNALELYYNDNDRYPPEGLEGTIDNIEWGSPWGSYMPKLPEDPSGVDYKYETDANGTFFRLYAKLERCSDNQTIPGTCETTSHNYAVTSTNAIAVALPTFTPTPTPTNTPTPTPTPTIIPKRIFVTSGTYVASNIGSLSGGDTHCQNRANDRSLGGTWKAWLSDGIQSPSTRFVQSQGVYRLLNGTKIADNWSDLVDGDIDAVINRTEFNSEVLAGTLAHTGTDDQGSSTSNHCNRWTSNLSSYGSTLGATDSLTDWSLFSTSNNSNCFSQHRLYCFEQ